MWHFKHTVRLQPEFARSVRCEIHAISMEWRLWARHGFALLEEFALNEDFLNLFLQKTGNAELFSYKIVSEEVSLTDAVLGESDLTIVLEKDGRNVALLIENKIHAIARPRQYERYVERGEKGVREEQYSAFYVFLIAPAEYMKNNSSAAKYPLKVTYEECRELFIASTTVRNQLKYQQLSAAIEQARRPYTK